MFCLFVFRFMSSLYINGGKCQYPCYKNIAQINAVDFMQIDETDIDIKIPASYDGQPRKVLHNLEPFSKCRFVIAYNVFNVYFRPTRPALEFGAVCSAFNV